MSGGSDDAPPVDVPVTSPSDAPADGNCGGAPDQQQQQPQQPAPKARRPRLGRAKAVSKPSSSADVAPAEEKSHAATSLPSVDAEFFAGLTLTLRKMENERRAKRLEGFSFV